MKKYEQPTIEIITINDDIITSSKEMTGFAGTSDFEFDDFNV